MRRWYLVHTKPSGEARAVQNLERQGYEVYLPRVLQPVRRRGRWLELLAPLFSRYLFLRLSEGIQALGPARCSCGVSDIVRFGSSYAVVPDRVITNLRARAAASGGMHRLKNFGLLQGSSVRVEGGAFDGLEGIFERENGADRAVVLLDILGRESVVSLSVHRLLPNQGPNHGPTMAQPWVAG
jgi:transcriptional antiterminator RfaH